MNSLQLTAHQVFAGLQLRRVIIDLKLPIKQTDQGLITPDPQNPEFMLQIEGSGFVSLGCGDPITACNLFDFLAMHFGSYQQAVDYLYDRFFNLAVMPPGLTWASVRDHLVESLPAERKQFEDILSLREALRRGCPNVAGVHMHCRKLGLSPDYSWPMFYVARPDELNRVLRPQSPFPDLDHAEQYWVFPYFKNHHTFSLLLVERFDGTPVRTVKLNPSRFMYFGLHRCLPGTRDPKVYATRQEALLQAPAGGGSTLHVLFDPGTELISRPIRKAVFVISAETDFNTIAQNQLAFERLDVASPADPTEPIPWLPYALKHIIATINADRNFSPRVAALVQSIKNDSVVFRELLWHLEKHNQDSFFDTFSGSVTGDT